MSNDLNDHDCTSIDNVICNKPKQNSKSTSKNEHTRNYMSDWEKKPEAMYKTYVYDELGNRCEKFFSWLYLKNNSMHCSLCEKHGKRRNTNGKSSR